MNKRNQKTQVDTQSAHGLSAIVSQNKTKRLSYHMRMVFNLRHEEERESRSYWSGGRKGQLHHEHPQRR